SSGTVGAFSTYVAITIPAASPTPTPAPTPAGPLPAPVNVSVSIVNGQPVVTWSAVSGAANYQIHRAIKSGSYALAGTVSGTTFTDNATLTVGKTYYYKVRACDSSGTVGAFSTYVAVTIPASDPNALAAPTGVTAAVIDSTPVITWNVVSGATQYKVYREADIKAYSLVGTVTGTSFTDTDTLDPGVYFYKIKAVNSNSESAYSAIVSVVILADGMLATPTGVTASVVDFKPVITWNAVSGATHYEIYREGDIKTYTLVYTVTGTSFTDMTLLDPGLYSYKIRAVNGDAVSNFSEAVSVEVSDIKQMTMPFSVLAMHQIALVEQRYAA
ncbi:MAG: hypothetical protein IKZ82_13465, partial [Clostridia bacterium]|nr:hypothetical protein [Clostridia bacterium]